MGWTWFVTLLVSLSCLFYVNGELEIPSSTREQSKVVFWDSSLHDGTRIEVATQVLQTDSIIYPATAVKQSRNPYASFFIDPRVHWPKRWAPELFRYSTHSRQYLQDKMMKNTRVLTFLFALFLCL